MPPPARIGAAEQTGAPRRNAAVRETAVLPTLRFIEGTTETNGTPEDIFHFTDRPNAAFSCVGSPTNGAAAATGIRAVFVLETARFSDDGASLSFEVRAGDVTSECA